MSNNTNPQNNINVMPNYALKTIANQIFSNSEDEIRFSNAPVTKMKDLTLDIMHDVSKQDDPKLMMTIAKTVRRWSDDEKNNWELSLKKFVQSYKNINTIYVGLCNENKEFILIVDNVFLDEISIYNEFCFSLIDQYKDIFNFYIFDKEEFENMKSNYYKYNVIYKRG